MWNPWNWIKAGWNFSFNAINQLYQWVLQQFGYVIDYVNGWITWLQNQINNAIQWASNLGLAIEKWAQSWFTWFIQWSEQAFNNIMSWASRLIQQAWSFIQETWDFAHWVYTYLQNLFAGWINDVYKWVQREIWDPLYNWVTGIYKQLTGWINYLLQYIQHPELLASLIGSYLIKAMFPIAKRLAVPFARWLMKTMMSMVGEFYDVIETVISHVL